MPLGGASLQLYCTAPKLAAILTVDCPLANASARARRPFPGSAQCLAPPAARSWQATRLRARPIGSVGASASPRLIKPPNQALSSPNPSTHRRAAAPKPSTGRRGVFPCPPSPAAATNPPGTALRRLLDATPPRRCLSSVHSLRSRPRAALSLPGHRTTQAGCRQGRRASTAAHEWPQRPTPRVYSWGGVRSSTGTTRLAGPVTAVQAKLTTSKMDKSCYPGPISAPTFLSGSCVGFSPRPRRALEGRARDYCSRPRPISMMGDARCTQGRPVPGRGSWVAPCHSASSQPSASRGPGISLGSMSSSSLI
jgi:hypothetical protein